MKLKHIYFLSAFLLFSVLSLGILDAQCCQPADSLKVRSVTDSSFCVQWLVNNSALCRDTARFFTVEYRPVNMPAWTMVSGTYHTEALHIFCDTATPCTKYQWRVRNVCVHNRDTIITAWVNGPKFTTDCDSGKSHAKATANLWLQTAHQLTVKPSPAQDHILVSGDFDKAVRVTITNINGEKKFDKSVVMQDGKLTLSISIINFRKGVYFVTIVDGITTLKRMFLKE